MARTKKGRTVTLPGKTAEWLLATDPMGRKNPAALNAETPGRVRPCS